VAAEAPTADAAPAAPDAPIPQKPSSIVAAEVAAALAGGMRR
jgi:hypothetical protein